MGRLSEAQRRRLSRAPNDWGPFPFFGDSRPNAPLKRAGLAEFREIVEASPEHLGGIRFVRVEWRITPAGRQALANAGGTGRKEPLHV